MSSYHFNYYVHINILLINTEIKPSPPTKHYKVIEKRKTNILNNNIPCIYIYITYISYYLHFIPNNFTLTFTRIILIIIFNFSENLAMDESGLLDKQPLTLPFPYVLSLAYLQLDIGHFRTLLQFYRDQNIATSIFYSFQANDRPFYSNEVPLSNLSFA